MLFLFAGPSYSIYLASENVVRENYMTLAAHFTADQLHKALRAQVNELLGVPVMQVSSSKFFHYRQTLHLKSEVCQLAKNIVS